MSEAVIITISRENGSGGREIGKRLAERMGIPFYDREIIALAAQTTGIDERAFEQLDRGMSEFSYSLAMLDAHNQNDRLFVLQSQTIRNIANRGSCVLVGRCADYVLRDYENVYNIFVNANSLVRAKTVELSGQFKKRSRSSLLKQIEETDARRRAYYEHYTGRQWGDAANYDLCIDSSRSGIATANIIQNFIEECQRIKTYD